MLSARCAVRSDLLSQLKQLGVRRGDLLMVHASMRKVGGRAEDLIAALDAAVGPEGTLLMMTSPANVERFDYLTTPADPDNGILAEIFRTSSGTWSSDHPEGRFSARGQLAYEFVDDVPWDDYYGPGSPLERLVAAGGKVLRLGADIDTVTLLHYSEYLADIPNKRRVTRRVASGIGNAGSGAKVVGSGFSRTITCLDDQFGIVDWPGPDYFGLILLEYLGTCRARHGQVGGAAAELIEAADLAEFGVQWMNAQLRASSG